MTLYYTDPYWMLYAVFERMSFMLKRSIMQFDKYVGRELVKHNLFWQIYRLITFAVGATYAGITSTTRHYSKDRDFVVVPKGVVLENTWTNYATSASGTVAVAPTDVKNSYLLLVVTTRYNSISLSSVSFGGSSMTLLTGGGSPSVSGYMYGLLSPSTTPGNVTFTLSSSCSWRAVVYQLSGVNQTTPTLDWRGNYTAAGSSWSQTVTTTDYGFSVDMCVADSDGNVSNGQTVVSVNSIPMSGYLTLPSVPTQTHGWENLTAHIRWGVVSFNPA